MRGDPFSSPYDEKRSDDAIREYRIDCWSGDPGITWVSCYPDCGGGRPLFTCCQTSELRSSSRHVGTATAVKKTTSRQGNNYTLFKLEDPRGCGAVNIFTWGHPKFSNGDHVRVEGVFETVHHQDRSIFYNQVEATKVVPLPK
jgi:hypothetical protein